MTLLYVEDDPDDREIFQEAVVNVAPHTVLYTADKANSAIKLLEEVTVLPDYIFLDMNLPEIGGMDFLKQIKKDSVLRTIPVIIYSTSNNDYDRLTSRKLGAWDFVAKANEFHQLCQILKRYI